MKTSMMIASFIFLAAAARAQDNPKATKKQPESKQTMGKEIKSTEAKPIEIKKEENTTTETEPAPSSAPAPAGRSINEKGLSTKPLAKPQPKPQTKLQTKVE